ncbi:hypothetical protein MSAN_00983600 [Mycena sanguinolenta]|uniref:HTH APSES-type domain-containing protein n=1 Tax=Mycena sanguinolenta TaxID=230812 RepID=A0A8H6YQG2_9AGAR|nr:hypothetical protein MSAN_00983600 [Mycena sanguinolenta]
MHQAHTSQHSYGTRIRHNIRIKPSARLRQSPAPNSRKPPKPLVFPPPHVVLHPDDANSKIFLAMGRSLMSVDNRAVTIKDLADMVVQHGFVCQKAITTYIRTHMLRCEVQQDHPLLLRHTLSGTPSDDDLLPALHSRSGGAHCGINTDNRATNFRRGTTVWYLSGATGAPCPFARAGIMLCEYSENGHTGSHSAARDKRKHADRSEECGSKRKRTLRGCAADSDSESSTEEVRPPPKVKLTLRLKPLRAFASTEPREPVPASKPEPISASDESMSEDESDDDEDDDDARPQSEQEEKPILPPYPRRSISIPCYTPSVDGPYPCFPPQTPYQRSSSVPYSVASLPPDSDEDDDGYHISMTGGPRSSTGRLHSPARFDSDWDQWDADDSEGDAETTWESPGPRSPSAPAAEVSVKQEDPLDSWDDFSSDTRLASAVKVESIVPWDWHSGYAPRPWDEDDLIKQEDDLDSLSSSFDNFRDPVPGPSSPLSPIASTPFFESQRRASDPASWRDSDTPELESEWLALESSKPTGSGTVRPRAKTVPSLGSFFSVPAPFAAAAPPLVVKPDPPALSLASLIQAMSMNSPTSTVPPSSILSLHPPACISPQETRCIGWSSDLVVVHTCLPCNPSITATQIEGISVYQMTLKTHTLLRRLDTDFVNLSPIVAYANTPYPVLSTIPNATVISRGSAAVKGTWVPLSAAQAYVRDHPLPKGVLDVFLSDALSERFPPALQEFARGSDGNGSVGRALGQFGAHFGSTLQATQLCQSSSNGSSPRREPDNIITSLYAPISVPDTEVDATEPLSSTEQQIFRELCITTDWDKESPATATQREFEPPPLSPLSDCPPDDGPPDVLDGDQALPEQGREPERGGRPLRRSKRVADAMIKTQSRARARTSRRT